MFKWFCTILSLGAPDPLDQCRWDSKLSQPIVPLRRKQMRKIAIRYAQGTFRLVFGIWRSDGMSWSRSMLLVWDIARTLLVVSAITNIWGEVQSNVVNLHFVSEVRPEVVWDILRSARVVHICLKKKEILFFQLALRFVVTYVCPVRWRRQDCRRKVKDGWFEGLIFFFNLGGQQVNVLLQNSEQSACDD